MKKVISIFLHTLCLLLTLTACGSANKAPDIDTGTPKTSQELADIRDTIGVSEPVKTGSGMDEKELLASLNGSAAFFECFAPDAEFVAAEIQINQRNTEKKQSDEIYATVTSVNKCSSYTTEFHWTYKYYSEGGWRMEALSQNGPGTYTINYWPQEEDLRTVWNDIYSEKYRNGQLEVCETERTGDDFVMFLVTYSVFSDIATEYAKTEVRFRFEDGRWITDSMSYPVDSTYEFNAEVYGMYLGTRLYDTSMTVYIMEAQSPVFPRLKRSRCRSSQEVNDSPTPFSALNYC